MLIAGPIADLDIAILEIAQGCYRELAALRDNLSTCIVLHTIRSLTLRKSGQFLNEDVLQVGNLSLILLVNLGKGNLVLLLVLASLDGTGEEFLVDDDTCQ